MIKSLFTTFILAALIAPMIFAGQFDQSGDSDRELPPRPTSVPTAIPTEAIPTPSKSDKPAGFIRLRPPAAAETADLWTAVEWQDPHTGQWYRVDGWAGHFDADREVTWLVGSSELGSDALFRWHVYTNESATEKVTTSDPFTLPTHKNVVIEIFVDW
ncbi:MAG: hypothetical protein AAF633_01335 [Chloroflexota bacterium]